MVQRTEARGLKTQKLGGSLLRLLMWWTGSSLTLAPSYKRREYDIGESSAY
jgi:hypothetical protein